MTKADFREYCKDYINLTNGSCGSTLNLMELDREFNYWDVVAEFTELKRLSIDGSGLTSLNPVLQSLVNIEYLAVRNCPIRIIPSFLGRLSKMQLLFFQWTKIEELPADIFQHPSIEEVHLEANKIKKLPELAHPNYRLRKLSFANNCLESIPKSFLEMLPNLELLNIAGNPLSSLTT